MKNHLKTKQLLAVCCLLIALLMSSCESSEIYSEYKKDGLSNLIWEKENKFVFTPTIEEDNVSYNISMAVRHTFPGCPAEIKYKYTMVSPSGKETVAANQRLLLLNDDKMPIGEVAGSITDITQVLLQDTKLEKGKYTFTIEQDGESRLVGFMEIGLIIAKAEKK
jgi:gliding motility-associated lipoprotein GldH